MANIDAHLMNKRERPDKFLANAPTTDPSEAPVHLDEHADSEEPTRMGNVDNLRGARNNVPQDERTRAVNIRNDKSISDIDWDLD
jgi:hypothetical protein